MMNNRSLKPGYFDILYEKTSDPWRFKTSEYEAEKYAMTCAALPRARYGSGVEIGCSIGVLTSKLASQCDRLLGIDVAKAAVDQAAQNCADLPHVGFLQARFPDIQFDAKFDLIVLSEVLYYFDDADMAKVANAVRNIANTSVDIVCVHWLGPTPDYPKTGDEALVAFENAIGAVEIMHRYRQANYRLDVFRISLACLP